MKPRRKKIDIDLLKKQSEQSRNGQPLTPGNGFPQTTRSYGNYDVTVQSVGKRVTGKGTTVRLVDENGRGIQLRIKRRRGT
ncbi:hypothetical protein [Spirosoma endbachense]|uniref:Uncharacterized protein n=1 Tax=Spirosoma endbachense TaxID=2666025 RepID=A0A6P1VYA5_9BACT|nr:hypothetical protein [Spirosoma endbachense]QHV97288.1 hypothetical protein GJR95_20765 [Spirosoma endbachense]